MQQKTPPLPYVLNYREFILPEAERPCDRGEIYKRAMRTSTERDRKPD